MQSISIALSAVTSPNNIVFSVRLKSPKLTDRLRNSVGSDSRPSGLQRRKPDGQM